MDGCGLWYVVDILLFRRLECFYCGWYGDQCDGSTSNKKFMNHREDFAVFPMLAHHVTEVVFWLDPVKVYNFGCYDFSYSVEWKMLCLLLKVECVSVANTCNHKPVITKHLWFRPDGYTKVPECVCYIHDLFCGCLGCHKLWSIELWETLGSWAGSSGACVHTHFGLERFLFVALEFMLSGMHALKMSNVRTGRLQVLVRGKHFQKIFDP